MDGRQVVMDEELIRISSSKCIMEMFLLSSFEEERELSHMTRFYEFTMNVVKMIGINTLIRMITMSDAKLTICSLSRERIIL